ncbi:MAG: hypothetical protein JXA50_01900 [Deltaproteobacteria bacterium]|nr:hypothetical protein [Deltaproteobacteria bacterium]
MASNGRVTNKEVYSMFADVQKDMGDMKGAIGKIEGKTSTMAKDLSEVKTTLQSHSEKIGILKGKAAVWGVLGGTVVTGIILLLINLFGKGP